MPGFVAAVQPSITVPIGLTHLYYICFLVGSTISATVYSFLHFVFPAGELKTNVLNSSSSRVLIFEYQEGWDREESTEFVSDIDESRRVVVREVF